MSGAFFGSFSVTFHRIPHITAPKTPKNGGLLAFSKSNVNGSAHRPVGSVAFVGLLWTYQRSLGPSGKRLGSSVSQSPITGAYSGRALPSGCKVPIERS